MAWAPKQKQNGFTLVELLIVIVVIAILAAITIVAYNGIQNRAKDTAVMNDLNAFGKKMELIKADGNGYPQVLTPAMGFSFTKSAYGVDAQGKSLRYCRNQTTDVYIMYAASKSGNYFQYIGGGTGLQSTAALAGGFGICSKVGLVSTNPSANGLDTATWADWTN